MGFSPCESSDALLFLRQRRNQLLQLLNEFGNTHGSDAPELLLANFTVLVGQEVPLSDDSPPGNFRMLLLKLFRDAAGGLADDLQLALHGRLEYFIPRIVMKGLARDELADLAGRFEHVPK
jgi:hypothetical protein